MGQAITLVATPSEILEGQLSPDYSPSLQNESGAPNIGGADSRALLEEESKTGTTLVGVIVSGSETGKQEERKVHDLDAVETQGDGEKRPGGLLETHMLQKRLDELTVIIEVKQAELENLKTELTQVEAQLTDHITGNGDEDNSSRGIGNEGDDIIEHPAPNNPLRWGGGDEKTVVVTSSGSVRPAGTRRLESVMSIEMDKAQKKDASYKKWFQYASLGLVVCITVLCLISIFAGNKFSGTSSNGGLNDRKCIDISQMQSYSNSSIVMNTLIEHCDCVPKWIGQDQGVYFQPFATLYIAIFAVLGFMFFNRFRPMLKSFIRGCARSNTLKQMFSKFTTEVDPIPTMVRLLKLFHDLPEHFQTIIEQELKLTWPDMPSIIADENQRSGATVRASDDTLIDERAGALAMCASSAFVDWFMQRISKGTAEVENMIDVFSTSMFSHSEEMYEETDRTDNVVIFFMELLLGVCVLIDYFFVQQWPSGSAWQCRWAYFAGVVMYKPYTVPMWFCLTLCCHYSFADKLNNNRRDLKSGTPYGAPFNRSKVSIFMMSTVALLQGIWFLVTFSVIFPLLFMFLPVILLPCFLIPFVLIFGTQKLLSLFSSYSMSHRAVVEGDETIDIEQETSSDGIPLQEFGKTSSESIIKQSSQNTDSVISSTSSNLKPTPFVESVFSLKAAATQLVSVSIIAFLLLPFYDKGIGWWQEGADQFVGVSFDLPNLVFEISYTLSWPKFKQPRLTVQLALGLFLAFLQLLFRFFKYMFFRYEQWIICSDKKPQTMEKQFQFVFSMVTWLPFRAAMEATQAAIPKLNDLWKEDLDIWLGVIPPKPIKQPWESHNYYGLAVTKYLSEVDEIKETRWYKGVWVISRLVFFIPMSVYVFFNHALFRKRSVKFNGSIDEVIAFLDTEDAMAYNEIVFGTKFDIASLYTACPLVLHKCCWAQISSDLQTPGEAFAVFAARSGFSPSLLHLLAQSGYGSVDDYDEYGNTALMNSVYRRETEIVKLLLEAKASVDLQNEDGNTALTLSAEEGESEIVKLLLEANASVDHQDKNGATALMKSAYLGKSEVVKLFLEAKANVDIQDEKGKAALDLAREEIEDKKVQEGRTEVIKLLEAHQR